MLCLLLGIVGALILSSCFEQGIRPFLLSRSKDHSIHEGAFAFWSFAGFLCLLAWGNPLPVLTGLLISLSHLDLIRKGQTPRGWREILQNLKVLLRRWWQHVRH